MKIVFKFYIVVFCILQVPLISVGQKVIFQEEFEKSKAQYPNYGINNTEYIQFTKDSPGFAKLYPNEDQNSDYIIQGINISNGVAFLHFGYKQEIFSGEGNGIKVLYRSDSLAPWKLLAYYTSSKTDWKQETLFLPENSASYYIMFKGVGKGNDIILLNNIHVDFYKKATAYSERNEVYIDTLYNVSSSFIKVEVSENQISGLPSVSNSFLTHGVPVVCPSNAITENEPDCYLNYKDITNVGCDTFPNNYNELRGCNDVVCGKSGIFTYNGSIKRDIDWYKLITNGTSSFTLKVVADFNIRVFVISMQGGCDGIWSYLGAVTSTIAGDTAIVNIASVTSSDNLFIWIAPNIGQTVPCGANYIMIYKTAPSISPPLPVASSYPVCTPTLFSPTISIPDYSFYWQNNSDGTSTLNPASSPFTVTIPGTYYVRGIYNPLSCWTSSSPITVNSPPTLSVNALPNTVCQSDPSVLTANGASTYTWMPGNLIGNQVTVNPATSTNYTVTGTLAGCSSSSTASLVVNPKYNFTENRFLCPSDFTIWHGQNLNTSGNYYLNYQTINGCDSIYTLHLSVVPSIRTLQIKVFLEGLYNVNGLMNQAKGISGSEFGGNIADRVAVELHDAVSPYTTRYQANDIDLFTNGMLTISDIPCNIGGLYYLVIKHIRSIETWSNEPIYFDTASLITYDFSFSASQAYGNNIKQIGNIFALFCGDINMDGLIDASDLAATDNASSINLVGYYPQDANGDGIVDASDMAIIDNNSTITVHVMKP